MSKFKNSVVLMVMISIFITVSCFSALAADSKTYNAIQGKAIIDGGIDKAWDKVKASPMDGFNQKTTDISGSVKMMWDTKYLYILVEVKDSKLSDEANSWWEKDGLTVYFDELNKKATKWEKDNPVTYACNFKGSIEGANKWTAKAKTTKTGYIVEGAVPIKKTKKIGDTIGIDFVLADNTGNWTRDNMLLWADKTGYAWANPSLFANVKLVRN